MTSDEPVVRFEDVELAFDDKVILDGVSFVLHPGHLKVILGASGAGKSTVLRLILGLLKPDAGRIIVHGEPVDRMSEQELMAVRANVGMVFQEGALFDSLTVRENVGYRLFEETKQPLEEVDARVAEVLGFVGLGEYGERMPSELSGGQRRRVAIARAIAAHPDVVLYDEPTTGLDPITSLSIGDEIIKLRDLQGTSSIIVTHQLRDAFHMASCEAREADGQVKIVPVSKARAGMSTFLMLKDGKVAFEGSLEALRSSEDAYLRSFLGDQLALRS